MKTREFIRQVPPLAWLIMVSVLFGGLFGNLLGSLTPEISADLTLSPKQIGWLVFWGSAGSAIGAFLGGDMVYRFRPRKLIFVYLMGMATAIVLLTFSNSFTMLVSSFMFYEVMVTGLFTLAHTLIGQMQLVSTIRARVLALLDVGWSIGASIAPIWVIVLLHIYPSWRVPYGIFFFFVMALIFAYAQPKMRIAIEQLSGFACSQIDDSSDKQQAVSHSYWQLMFAPWAIWAWIAGILIGYVEWGHSYWFVNYAHIGRDIDLDQARLGLVGFTLGMVLVRGWQAFIHSEVTIEQRLIRLSLIGCIAYLLIAFLPPQAALYYVVGINFLAGIGIGIVFPILLNHLIDFAPHDTAKFSALLMFSIIIGSQLAGLVIGYVSEHLGIGVGYMTIAFAMLGFFIATMRLFSIHRKMQHAPE